MTAKPDTKTLTADELLARASALLPALKERAPRTEELRRVPEETVKDLLDSGLYRIGVPKRFGGLDVDYGLALDVAAEPWAGMSFHRVVLLPLGCPRLSGWPLAARGTRGSIRGRSQPALL